MEKAIITQHQMHIEFICPNVKQKVCMIINNPYVQHRQHYSDWDYQCIEIKCQACGKSHTFEI